jgi:hypothetical protein
VGWINLGTQQLALDQWVSFTPSINGETFRFTPTNLADYPAFKTYALVRMAWADGVNVNHTQPRRIYPRPEPIIIDFEIPLEIKAAGGLVWYPQANKQIYYRWRGRSQEPPWGLLIEDFDPNT